MPDEREVANANLNKALHSILKGSLNRNGFTKRTNRTYMRITDGDLLQSIGIQKHSWQTTFTINIFVYQLYQGQLDEHLTAIITVRQGSLYTAAYRKDKSIEELDHWFDFGDLEKTTRSVETLRSELEMFIFPFLDAVSSNMQLAEFVFERTVDQTPDFIQSSATWSNYLAGMLALRLEDPDHAIYFLNQSIKNAGKIEYAWGKKLRKEAMSLKELFEKDEEQLNMYFQKNIANNMERIKLKQS
ncbi:MAG: DUF4304 domain-containing protein [Chitinophagales bacterium]